MPEDVEFERGLQERDAAVVRGSGSPSPHDDGSQGELMASWQRSRLVLGGPENVTDVPQVSEEVLDAHLLDMFRAPLAQFADGLGGTGLGVLLADSRGQILHRWCGDRTAVNHLDRIGTMRGADLSEGAVGTNGVGTVVATGRGLQIQGREHFADFYRDAVCTGAPVRHPMTGNLMAVVTLSSDVTPRADLLRPMLDTVVQTLCQHVLDMQEPAARRTFDAFLNIARSRAEPVVAFGAQGLLIQNRSAGSLQAEDLGTIQQLCADGVTTGRWPVTLSCGQVQAQITEVEPGNRVVMLRPGAGTAAIAQYPRAPRDGLVGRAREWQTNLRQVEQHSRSGHPLLIAGEAGTGKLSLALGRPSDPEHVPRSVLHAAAQHVQGHREWLRDVAGRVESGRGVVVHGVHTLEPRALDGLGALMASAPRRAPIMVTATAEGQADAEALAMQLDIGFTWVPPVRERAEDILLLWEHFAARLGAPRAMVPLRETEEILRAHPWPGNVRGVRTVVAHLVAAGHRGPVRKADLPEGIQWAGELTMIERVELEAIRKALREAGGNRARAAAILGLSRATVHRKVKAYHLD